MITLRSEIRGPLVGRMAVTCDRDELAGVNVEVCALERLIDLLSAANSGVSLHVVATCDDCGEDLVVGPDGEIDFDLGCGCYIEPVSTWTDDLGHLQNLARLGMPPNQILSAARTALPY